MPISLFQMPYAGQITVTQGFGGDISHNGNTWSVDFSASFGASVLSVAGGVVVGIRTGSFNGDTGAGSYGNFVTVRHDGGFYATYAHLNLIDGSIGLGAQVVSGQVLGTVGDTGFVNGAHIHVHFGSGTSGTIEEGNGDIIRANGFQDKVPPAFFGAFFGSEQVGWHVNVSDPSTILASDIFGTSGNDGEAGVADNFHGRGGNDRIFGGGGNDVLSGWGGDDLLVGGTGVDYFNGGAGIDTVSVSYSPSNWNVDLSQDAASAEGLTETLISIENFIGGFGDDSIIGDAAANILTGDGSASGINTLTIKPGLEGQDLWVTNFYSYNDDYGVDDDVLRVGGWGDFYNALLRFDLNAYGLSGQASSAILRLYNYSYNNGSPVSLLVDKISTNWDESYGWHQYSLSSTQIAATQPVQLGWIEIDITQAVNGWLSDPATNFGIRLRPTLVSNNFAVFASSDATGAFAQFRPELVVSFSTSSQGTGSFDTIRGGGGSDWIFGGIGDDLLFGEAQHDRVLGESGNDVIDAGTGNDVVDGGGQRDSVFGGSGFDSVDGGAGNDTLTGGADGDTLLGGAGFDILQGDAGDDVLNGGASNDVIFGNAGNDTIIFEIGGGTDTLRDFTAGAASEDVINLVGFGAAFDSFGEVIAAATQTGNHVAIDFGNGDVLIIRNTLVSALHADDFTFG